MRSARLLPVLCANAAALAAAPLDEAAQKQQLESLFNAVRPVAAGMLASQGEFTPLPPTFNVQSRQEPPDSMSW